MTKDDFNEWLTHHKTCFTGIECWLDKVTSGDKAPTRTQILSTWATILRDVELSEAKRASIKMAAGEIEEPKGFDRHPAAIRKAAGVSRHAAVANAPRYDLDGNQTYACLTCMDDGWVRCWHPQSMAQAKAGKPIEPYSVAVVCTCAIGQTKDKHRTYPRYDAKRWLRLDGWHDTDTGRLCEFVDAMRPANYDPAFSEFAP